MRIYECYVPKGECIEDRMITGCTMFDDDYLQNLLDRTEEDDEDAAEEDKNRTVWINYEEVDIPYRDDMFTFCGNLMWKDPYSDTIFYQITPDNYTYGPSWWI